MRPTCPQCKKKLPAEHRWHGFHEKCFEPHFGVPVLVGGSPRTVRRLVRLTDPTYSIPSGEADWLRLYCEPKGLVQGLELTDRGRKLAEELRPRLAMLDEALAKRDAATPTSQERAW